MMKMTHDALIFGFFDVGIFEVLVPRQFRSGVVVETKLALGSVRRRGYRQPDNNGIGRIGR
jgi:hypothetical protein